jgi:hypothetical protein
MMAIRCDTSAEHGPHTVTYSFIPPPTPAEAAILARFTEIMDDGLANLEPGTRFSYDVDLGIVRVTFAAGLRAIVVDGLAKLYLLGAQRVMGRSDSVSIFRTAFGEFVAVGRGLDDDGKLPTGWSGSY